MRIGCPKETKIHEYRAGLVPATVRELKERGHDVLIEHDAGAGIGVSDEIYKNAGAQIAKTAADVFAQTDMIVKVKEPLPNECDMLRKGQILFTYLHLAADPSLTKAIMASGATAIAYETVTDDDGHLPLLLPMSQVAGRMSIQVGAHFLEKEQGGRGVLLSGVPGVEGGTVVIIGGGTAGTSAAIIARGMGAEVVILEYSMHRIQQLDDLFSNSVQIVHSSAEAIEHYVPRADILVGAVLAGPGVEIGRASCRERV